ncbi:uncharacterized protein PRCAT00000057001 [Priceomyces carsonii]|uniref:uncharacterized protein n=1 Tax=Priceomyces carsonii TaxID=28549 RepID=UPI002EDA3AFF|nr:unnamed protein product [Priceomyces carsonii]
MVAVSCSESESPSELIAPIDVIGNKFFDSKTGNQFFIKGIAYQHSRSSNKHPTEFEMIPYWDSLTNASICERDVKYLKEIGINTIRVYQVDPLADHDQCMNIFLRNGIYVLADLSEPSLSINREFPAWDVDLIERYTSVVDSLHKYDNVLGFFAGNEVTNSNNSIGASPFVKAAIRDIKAYMKNKRYRKIPVGYAASDNADIRHVLSSYFICDREEDRTDFFGINMYEWCGYSSYPTSGYRERTEEYKNFPVPIFFSEYGCNVAKPRPFTEVESLYGQQMAKVWSGGIAYQYFQEEEHDGLVKENSDGSLTILDDFYNFKNRLNSISVQGIHKNDYDIAFLNSSYDERENHWYASNSLPEKPDSSKCECLQSTLSCILTPYMEVHETSILNELCSVIDCSDIEADGLKGKYGRFSDCSIKQKISYALNKHYLTNDRRRASCEMSGRGILVTNSGEIDLASIYAGDGRTCQEAIGDAMNYEKEKHNQRIKNYLKPIQYIVPKSNFHSWARKNVAQSGAPLTSFPHLNNLWLFMGILFVVM